MAYFLSLLENVDTSVLSTFVLDILTIMVVFFRTKRKSTVTLVEQDLSSLIEYHEKAAKKLRDVSQNKGE